MTELLHLSTLTRGQGANAALLSGAVTPARAELDVVEVSPLPRGFRRMVRGLEFDVAEMAVTTYLVAREHGVPFTALPVFLVRGFHHGAIQVASGSVGRPEDLAGRRVGVNRGYTVTTGVWARGVLAAEYGLDLDGITWVTSDDEHVEGYRPPLNVESAPAGTDLAAEVASGALAAVIGAAPAVAGVEPLLPDPEAAALAALRRDGFHPINHLVVVRDDLLAAHPWLAEDLFEAFAEAKRRYVADLVAGAIPAPDATDRLNTAVATETDADPLPYGVEPNRAALEHLVDLAHDQHILSDRPEIDTLFAAGTRALVA
ncbi:hypothetical protein WIS52_05090 [Pseudonocardia nematodicida]|uniref:4,5-dihydroxyphthalate decarboxylase n=1 Tax=Pseudonocardia nematodicida TaxID=1206997 RepID=A0ABV1K5U2_9PSEU